MNRNHFDRPLQGGGRDGFGYGHTDLEPLTASDKRILVALVLSSGLVVAALLYAAWVALDSL